MNESLRSMLPMHTLGDAIRIIDSNENGSDSMVQMHEIGHNLGLRNTEIRVDIWDLLRAMEKCI